MLVAFELNSVGILYLGQGQRLLSRSKYRVKLLSLIFSYLAITVDYMNQVSCLSLSGWINVVTWPHKKLLSWKTYRLELLSTTFWSTVIPTPCHGMISFPVALGLNKSNFGDTEMSPVGLRYRLRTGSNPDPWSAIHDQPPRVVKPSVSFRLNKFCWLSD